MSIIILNGVAILSVYTLSSKTDLFHHESGVLLDVHLQARPLPVNGARVLHISISLPV